MIGRTTKKTAILLSAISFGAQLNAGAQLAGTQLDGLQIQVASIYRFGDSRDLDCSIGLKFTGTKADRSIGMSPVKIIQAVDDTGMDLVRTNKHSFSGDDWPSSKTTLRFWPTVGGLKAPAPDAKAIQHLEAEVVLFAPTTGTPVLTNFMSRPGTVLHQPMLDQYQVKISYDRRTNHPPPGGLIIDNSPAGKMAGKTVSLEVDDPQHKLVCVAFQTADGRILSPISKSQGTFGSHTELTYGFSEMPPPDLNLVVYVASPEATERVRFSLDNIRLPWVEVPDFEASAKVSGGLENHGTNPFFCNLTISFTGGPLTNALGIRKLWIEQAEDDSGHAVKVGFIKMADGVWNWRFDALPPVMGDGRYVRKFVPLVFQSHNPKMIRILKGEAELIRSSTINGGVVVIKDFLNRAGESLHHPLLKKNQVVLAYLGPVNYAATRAGFIKTNFVAEQNGLLPKESPANNNNSLLFSLDDPDHVVFAPWGCDEITILDAKGRPMPAVSTMISGKFRVYRFKTLPPPGSQVQVYLAVSESLQRVPFKIENISLN